MSETISYEDIFPTFLLQAEKVGSPRMHFPPKVSSKPCLKIQKVNIKDKVDNDVKYAISIKDERYEYEFIMNWFTNKSSRDFFFKVAIYVEYETRIRLCKYYTLVNSNEVCQIS